jgi:hypothetical protein
MGLMGEWDVLLLDEVSHNCSYSDAYEREDKG